MATPAMKVSAPQRRATPIKTAAASAGDRVMLSPAIAHDIPPALRDWQACVLRSVPGHACRLMANEMPNVRTCERAWPRRRSLDTHKNRGRLSLDGLADAPGWMALPGDALAWPQGVVIGKPPIPVMQRDNQLVLWLTARDYRIQGAFPWTIRPARLRVPARIGLVALTVDNPVISRSERQDDELTLGDAAGPARRRCAISACLPAHAGGPAGHATLEIRLQSDVTGGACEQRLGPALPVGFLLSPR